MLDQPGDFGVLDVEFFLFCEHAEQLFLVELFVSLQLSHLVGCLLHRLLVLDVADELDEVGELRLGGSVSAGVLGGSEAVGGWLCESGALGEDCSA